MTAKETSKAWRQANKDKVREYKRTYYWRNLESTRARNRAYYAANREQILAHERQRRIDNSDAILEKDRARRLADPEKFRQWTKDHKRAKPNSWRLYGIRKTAKAKGLACDLDVGWFETRIAAGICEMSGLPFDLEGKRTPNSPSVDRIDPKGPYTKDNCRLILWWLNRAMSDLGEEYALMVFRAVIEKRKREFTPRRVA